MTGWYVTANDIKNWTATNKRRAEEVLPLLVKKLILASYNPKKINFRQRRRYPFFGVI